VAADKQRSRRGSHQNP